MHHALSRFINNAQNTHAQSLETFPCQCKICRYECTDLIRILSLRFHGHQSHFLFLLLLTSHLNHSSVPSAPFPAYSTFNPTFPNPLIPPAQITPLTTQAAKQVQKLALYPSHKANIPPCALAPSAAVFAAVTLAATIDVIAKPTELPIWAIVLKTPPAKACVRTGKRDVIAKFEIVYNTIISIFRESALWGCLQGGENPGKGKGERVKGKGELKEGKWDSWGYHLQTVGQIT